MSSPNYPVLCCPQPDCVASIFVHVVSPLLGWSLLSPGLPVTTHNIHRSSLRRLMCPAKDHLIFLTLLIIFMSFVISLTRCWCSCPSVLAAASLFCACLVSVHVSAPYVIAGSTQELYTCLFRQMARLLLKISRCLAYAAQRAMILRCISLSWFFSLRL